MVLASAYLTNLNVCYGVVETFNYSAFIVSSRVLSEERGSGNEADAEGGR